jgi:hypothetical protein
MSLQKFPVASIQKIEGFIKGHLSLPAVEHHPQTAPASTGEDMPEPSSIWALGDLFRTGSSGEEMLSIPNSDGRWFISTVDVSSVFARLPGLKLKPNYRLVTYLLRDVKGGMGSTWAIPDHRSATVNLEEALKAASLRDNPPYPEGALLNIMAAIEGDRSPLSFMMASILQRELQEFGRCGADVDWGHHRFISTVPQQRQWHWRMAAPSDLEPKVRLLPDGQAAVEFFTCRVAPPVAIFRHVDHYPVGQYQAKSINQPVATVAEVARTS